MKISRRSHRSSQMILLDLQNLREMFLKKSINDARIFPRKKAAQYLKLLNKYTLDHGDALRYQ